MKVSTSFIIKKTPQQLWPLLCNSQMDNSFRCAFSFCVPKPVECRLPDGKGNVGGHRQCVSNRGVINQKITEWNEPYSLRFEMDDTDIYFGPCVKSIREHFTLEEIQPGRTKITRTTLFQTQGVLTKLKALLIYVALKNVHKYVFQNWSK